MQRRILRVFRFRPPPRRTSLRSALVRRCSPASAPPPPRSPRNSSSQSIPHRTNPQRSIRKSIYKSINIEWHLIPLISNIYIFFFRNLRFWEIEKHQICTSSPRKGHQCELCSWESIPMRDQPIGSHLRNRTSPRKTFSI